MGFNALGFGFYKSGGGSGMAAGLTYKGTWNANTNTPTLGNGGAGGVQGDYYIVSVAGNTSLDGETDWGVGDWVVNNGSEWQKIDNSEPPTLYRNDSTIGTSRVATITDTLKFSGGTVDHTYTSGALTVRQGSGVDPVGLGNDGAYGRVDVTGGLTSYSAVYNDAGNGAAQLQAFDVATDEKASVFVGQDAGAGAAKSYISWEDAPPSTTKHGLEANSVGELFYSQSGGLSETALTSSDRLAFIDASGYLKVSTYADVAAQIPTLYGGNGTVGSARVATLTDTLTFSGGTTIHSYTSGASTVQSGTGFNPIGFSSTGTLSFISNSTDFDVFNGNYVLGGEVQWVAQSYNNVDFIEQACMVVQTANFSGTIRPQASIYYSDTGVFNGFQATVFGERLLSQSTGLNIINPISSTVGIAFVSGAGGAAGYIGVSNQAGLAGWLGNELALSSVLAVGNTTGGTDIEMSSPDRIVFNSGDASIGWDDNIADYLTIEFDGDGMIMGTSANIAIDRGILLDGSAIRLKTVAPRIGFEDPVVGNSGDLEVATLTATRNWTLPDQSGTIALISDLTITNDVVPRGTGTGIEDGTWQNVGNDFRPLNAGSNLGGTAVANRISTIYMASTIDFSGTLDFSNGTNIVQSISGAVIHNPNQIASIDYVWRSDTNATALVFDATAAGNVIVNGTASLGSGFTVYANGGFGAVFQGSSTSASAFIVQMRNGSGTTTALFRDSGRIDLALNGAAVNVGAISSNFQLNVHNNMRVQNSVGNAEIEINATVGQAFLQINNTQASLDSYIHFANSNSNQITIGWDDSIAYYRMGTSAITTNTWFEYNPANNQARYASSLSIGSVFTGASTQFLVRGAGATSATFSVRVQNSSGFQNFAVGDDGVSYFQTTNNNPIGVGAAQLMAGDVTTTTTASEFNMQFRMRHNPSADGNGRTGLMYLRAFKEGVNDSIGLTGLISESYNAGTGDFTNASIGMVGVLGQARNIASNTTITNMYAIEGNVQTQASVGNEATITNMGGLRLYYNGISDTNVTNLYGVNIRPVLGITNGSLTNYYGFRMENSVAAVNNWGMYIEGANVENYIQGNLSIGATKVVNSPFEVTGDIEVIGGSNGLILEDRTTGTRYRVYIDNNQIFTEAA